MEKKKVVLYLRLSKEDIICESVSESIKNQELILRDYAECNGWEIVGVYCDDDYSGLYEERPAFQEMIQDAYKGKFDIVLSKNQSRFTRNMVHMEKYLHQIFPRLGIRFIGVLDGVDTDKKTNKKARQIYALTNEWYCEDLSENIRMVFKKKMLAGQNIAAYAPYGYQKAKEDHHKLVIDQDAAKVVKKIYQDYRDSKTIVTIASELDRLHIQTPLEYRNKVEHNRLWSTSTIKKILSNRTYIGELIQGMSERISYKDKKLRYILPEDWICIPNHHEPIISLEEFEQVQKMRVKRRKK